MKWITRERPKTDRIACPWLIRKYIDREAEILYVPADDVLPLAEEQGVGPSMRQTQSSPTAATSARSRS